MPEIKVTLDVTCQSEEVLETYCVDFLKSRGFNVVAPREKWESVGTFKKRLGISYGTVANKVRERANRPNVVIQRGEKSKQIVAILSNADFDAFCIQNK